MDGSKDSIYSTTGLLIGLNAGIAVLLILTAAILVLLIRRWCGRTLRSSANSEISPINPNQLVPPAVHSRTNYAAFHTPHAPAEMSITGYSALVSQVGSQYYPKTLQAMVPRDRIDIA